MTSDQPSQLPTFEPVENEIDGAQQVLIEAKLLFNRGHCNKLLVKLGLKAEAIARPGTVGKRDRIYQISGMVNPLRDRLLEAARRRLTEASPGFDESSVADGLECCEMRRAMKRHWKLFGKL